MGKRISISIEEIIRLRKEGLKQYEIADKLQCSRAYISVTLLKHGHRTPRRSFSRKLKPIPEPIVLPVVFIPPAMCRLAEFDPIIRRAIRARMGEKVEIPADLSLSHLFAWREKKRRERSAPPPKSQ